MKIKECTIEDVPLLAKLYKLFFEEEKSETNLHLPHLEERMRGYINSEFKAFLFLQDDKIVGYTLCDISKTPVYLRQFFISREERRKGYGKQALAMVMDHLNIKDSNIDAYHWDDSGSSFLKSVGIKPQRSKSTYSK